MNKETTSLFISKDSRQWVRESTPTYPFGGDTNYSYEDRGQLGGETSARGATYSHAFAYDGAGNPTTWKGQSRTFNSNNQETTGGFFGYNGDGSPWKYLNRNLADAQNPNGKAQVYSYNVRGQLQQVNGLNADGTTGATQMQSLYRGDGKRAWKQGADSTNRVYFFYDGDMLLGSSDQNGDNAGLQLWGADGVIGSQRRDAQGVVHSSYNLYDTQGNLAQMLDENGAVVGGSNGATAFTAWGERVPRAGGALSSTGGGYGAKFGYIRDGETGFYLCTYRHYDPSAGRWITRDPISYNGGSNLYGYVDNDPANMTDPDGLLGIGVEIGGRQFTSTFYGWGGPDFLFDSGSAANFGGDAEKGWYPAADGLNPLGDPYLDMSYWKEDCNSNVSFILGQVSQQALVQAATGGLSQAAASGKTVELLRFTPQTGPKTGVTLIKVMQKDVQKWRFDIGKLDPKNSMPPKLVDKVLPHLHRRGPGGIGRQWPWDRATRPGWKWPPWK